MAAISVLGLAWIVYPGLLFIASRSIRRPDHQIDARPAVGIVIATRDTPSEVALRVADIRRSDYPPQLLDVVVAIDAGSAYPIEDYSVQLGSTARTILGDLPRGKAGALNAGVRAVNGEILVFGDTSQVFDPDAIGKLVSYLADPAFGAVTGTIVQRRGDLIVDLYWRYELFIRRAQSALHSVVTTSGAIQAVRRHCWRDIPGGLICDDLFTSLTVASQGLRVGYCADALARDSRVFTHEQQFWRRVRTLTGLVQICSWVPSILLPWKNPLWIHFLLHKLARIATPFLLLAVCAGGLTYLVPTLPGAWWLMVFVAMGFIALIRPSVLRHAGWLMLLQAAPLVAVANGVRRHWDVWRERSIASEYIKQS